MRVCRIGERGCRSSCPLPLCLCSTRRGLALRVRRPQESGGLRDAGRWQGGEGRVSRDWRAVCSVQDSVLRVFRKPRGPQPPVRGSRAFDWHGPDPESPAQPGRWGLDALRAGRLRGPARAAAPALLGLESHSRDFSVSLWDLSLHFGLGNFEADVRRRHRP